MLVVAKYRAQLLEPDKKGPKGEGFEVLKSGGEHSNATTNICQELTSRRACLSDWFPIGRKVDPAVKSHKDGICRRSLRVHDIDCEFPPW
jgi:hypothetical protein